MVEHPVKLRGAGLGTAGRVRPLILQRIDQEFLPAVFHELASEAGRARTLASEAVARDANGTLRLFQPVHRTFHVVLMEAVCDRFGEPRLDPTEIESAGMVVRRVASPRSDSAHTPQAWMQNGGAVRGWIPVPEAEKRVDPDPARRRPPLRAGPAALVARLPQPRRELDGLAETVAPLFVAPPEVCRAAGRTLLFGLVPVTSAERSEVPPQVIDPSDDDLRLVLPAMLRAGSHAMSPGDVTDREDVVDMLSLLTGLGVFEPDGDAKALLPLLNAVTAWVNRSPPLPPLFLLLGNELRRAAGVFREPSAPRLQETLRWTIDAAAEASFAGALRTVVQQRVAALAPGSERFDPRGGTYELHAFVRVRRADGCPPALVWCEAPSDPFTIVPWYETGGAPPVTVVLPDPTDREALKKLKPSVAFITPNPVVAKLRGTKLGKLITGEGPPSAPGLAFDWVCGFNIPIITLCAFIVLFIFLTLLNIVFWWLPFVKVCFPIPRRS